MERARLVTTCDCGCYCQPLTMWVTDSKSLLVVCYCISCEKEINVLFPLTMLYKDCPPPVIDPTKLNDMVSTEIARITDEAGKPLIPPLNNVFTVKDLEFLQILKVLDERSDDARTS